MEAEPTGNSSDPETFQERAERLLGWSPADFERRLFFAAVPPVLRPAARLLWGLRHRLFADDLRVITALARATGYNAVAQLAGEFAHPHRNRTFLRDGLGIRPHGRRVLDLAREVFIDPLLPRRPAPHPPPSA